MEAKKIDISNLEKVYARFNEYRVDMKTNRDKTAAIKEFELCLETASKMMKRFLEANDVEVNGFPKDTFRKAAVAGFIINPEIWFNFQKIRNQSVHDYDAEHIEKTIAVFDTFSIEISLLIEKLKRFL